MKILWRLVVVVITTAQLNSKKSQLRLVAVSNPARTMSEICDSENLREWSQLEIRHECLSSVNHSAKTVYHIIIKKLFWLTETLF